MAQHRNYRNQGGTPLHRITSHAAVIESESCQHCPCAGSRWGGHVTRVTRHGADQQAAILAMLLLAADISIAPLCNVSLHNNSVIVIVFIVNKVMAILTLLWTLPCC